jgi:hypothetical protein
VGANDCEHDILPSVAADAAAADSVGRRCGCGRSRRHGARTDGDDGSAGRLGQRATVDTRLLLLLLLLLGGNARTNHRLNEGAYQSNKPSTRFTVSWRGGIDTIGH